MSNGSASVPDVQIAIESHPVANFALQQNDVPIVQRLHVTNRSSEPLRDLQVILSSEPELFPRWESRIGEIAAGATHVQGPLNIQFPPQYLMDLTERLAAQLRIDIRLNGFALPTLQQPIEVLAFDEWSGLDRSLPEMLAAFVLPNHPEVDRLLSDAANHLGKITGDSSLSGYQSKSPSRVAHIAQAIYLAIQSRGLKYCSPPASFEHTGQKIRLPDRVFEHQLATCLDIAVLFAACLEQSGLHPLVVLTKGHAFAGVWLNEDCFSDCVSDDVARLRKRADLNEILVFETTLVTAPPPSDFAYAVASGRKHLWVDECDFRGAVDIFRCRKNRIRPLPIRRAAGELLSTPTPDAETHGSEAFELPVVPTLAAVDSMPGESPAARLDKWKRKLLDLTLHNRLLNFKESKKTVRILCPDLTSLEDALADGLEFQVLSASGESEFDDIRDSELHHTRTGMDLNAERLAAEFLARRLYTSLSNDELARRLIDLFRTARTAMEEGGASGLYLALGFLVWFDSDVAEQRHVAPIILIPIEIRRNSAADTFRICQSDEEPRINVTLLEMLKKDFGLEIQGLDPLPTDDHGIDVRSILMALRQSIKEMRRWDVLETAQVGLFSFTKFLMWRDLERRTKELLRNKVVDHLVNRPEQRYPDDGEFPDASRLDETQLPQQTFCPLLADSSQLCAIQAAARGKSFVLFGPPGTGKSQTIANLIAQCLAEGKSVLFVSEKMAALDVVYRRLDSCGLGPFCLEMHSNKTHKRHVVDQLGQSLDRAGARPGKGWEEEAQRLSTLRTELNHYVDALHQLRRIGVSAFDVCSKLIGLRDRPRLDLKLTAPEAITQDNIERWHEIIGRLQTAGAACGHPSLSEWASTGLERWSPALQRSLEGQLTELQAACDRLEATIAKLEPYIKLGTQWNHSQMEYAEKFVKFLQTSPLPPEPLVVESQWDATESEINTWIAHGRKRDILRKALFTRYEERLLTLDLDSLASRLSAARATWFLPRLLQIRRVRRELKSVSRGDSVLKESLAEDLENARTLRSESKYLVDCADRAQALFGSRWRDGEPDWDELKNLVDWVSRCRKFAIAVSGGDPSKTNARLRQFARLAINHHSSLQPGGEIGRTALQYLDAFSDFEARRTAIEVVSGGGDRKLWGEELRRITLSRVREKARLLQSNLPGLKTWCNWREVRSQAIAASLQSLVDAYEAGTIQTTDLRDVFDRNLYEWWFDSVTDSDDLLRGFFRPQHERKIEQFRESDSRFTALTRSEVEARLAGRRPAPVGRTSDESEIGILQRQRKLRRGIMPARQLFQRIPNLLRRLKPCLLMSPISVAQYLDASHPAFDLVVFDEASQIPVWDAVGAIGRGTEVVIVGDPKQLPPTSFFMRSDEEVSDAEAVVEDVESVLDECLSANLPQLNLKWHYRSRDESLIAFSNHFYYDNNLLTFPAPSTTRGVSFRHVPGGVYDKGKSRTNRAEADAITAEVIRRLLDPELSRYSIGIVTFSAAQQVLVEDLLDEVRRRHPEIESRFCDDSPEPVFIKNLENVQGDERDVILFSVCYGPDAEGRVSMNFGPINRDGGERRLNVAITRARREVIVFSTLRSDQIDLSRSRARGVNDLKCFLDYTERGPIAISQSVSLRGGDAFESPFEKQVCDRLLDSGYEVHSQVGCSGYRIDLAVVDPQAKGRYLIGIECDGANYHSAKTARDRDRLRAAVLEGLGWKLHRVWSSDWWINADECLARIEAAIERASLDCVRQPAVAASQIEPKPIPSESLGGASPPENLMVAPTSDGPPAYRAIRIGEVVGSPSEFYQSSAESKIGRLIEEIVAAEGPVSIDVVASRVVAHWQMSRRGATIVRRIEEIAARCNVSCYLSGETTFLWPTSIDPKSYCGFRVPGAIPDEQRRITDIPLEEIANAAAHVLSTQVSLPIDELIRETSLLLGFERTGSLIQRTIDSAVTFAMGRGRIRDDGRGRLVADGSDRSIR